MPLSYPSLVLLTALFFDELFFSPFHELYNFLLKARHLFRRIEVRKIDFMPGKAYTCFSARILLCKMSQELG